MHTFSPLIPGKPYGYGKNNEQLPLSLLQFIFTLVLSIRLILIKRLQKNVYVCVTCIFISIYKCTNIHVYVCIYIVYVCIHIHVGLCI